MSGFASGSPSAARAKVTAACQAFEAALRVRPDFAAAHIGMANANLLAYEATRRDCAPDWAAVTHAERHAREGCRLEPASGEAWATLAFVEHRRGRRREAVAAAQRAVLLEPDEWRHQMRLALVSWGGERLRAAHHVLTLCPGLGVGHWCAATVFVAREAFDKALEALRASCADQDAHRQPTGPFTTVGLHLLHGLVLDALGDAKAALAELERELAFEDQGRAIAFALEGKHEAAAHVCREALLRAAPGPDGWLLPVGPLLQPTRYRDAWAPTLATLRDRAV